jgi:peptide/nickel transport system substrate-binding protein
MNSPVRRQEGCSMPSEIRHRCITVLALLCVCAGACAQDLAIGLATPLHSIDPHERNVAGHNSVIDHVFETLVGRDAHELLRPALAESWKAVDALTWEFKLRKGVHWHDGTAFTVHDVIASLRRVAARPDGVSSFGQFTRRIESVGSVDRHTLRIRTLHTHPLLAHDLASIRIVPAASVAAADAGVAAVPWPGTGPFKLSSFAAGDRVTLERNDAYWGARPAWRTLTLRFIARGSARVAALLGGEVQMIEDVPGAELARLAKETGVQIVAAVTSRLIYLHVDSQRSVSPFVSAKNGRPLPGNPLQDERVRRAMSLALDRAAIVGRHLAGRAVPAGQLLPPTHAGTSRQLAAEPVDLARARRLLADAGYADGFALSLHTPKNRYPKDMPTAHAVAGMLSRVGIRVRVEALPVDVFFARMGALDFSFYLAGWSTPTGEASSPLRALIGSFDARSGMGQANRGRFSDAGVDALIRSAMTTLDEAKRNALLAEATEKAIGERQALIPLLHETSSWALRRGYDYTARSDQATYAFDVRPAPPP